MSNRGVGALADLKWKLQIFGLHNVTSYESATRTNLSRKSGIEHLGLFWSGTEKEHHANYVLEGLKPHWKKSENFKNSGLSNLSFPSLMGKEKFSLQFGNWIEIKLDRLNECKQLPSLGNLPCLQILHIFGLYKVICIGKGFYGSTCMASSNILSSNRKAVLLFPSLKELRLLNMHNLVDWSGAMIPPACRSIKVFPNLGKLYLYGLPKLDVLPNLGILTRLQRLEIHHCQSLTCLQDMNRITSLQVLEIYNCPTSFGLQIAQD